MRAVRAQSTVPGKAPGKWYPSIAGNCFSASFGTLYCVAQCSATAEQKNRTTEQ